MALTNPQPSVLNCYGHERFFNSYGLSGDLRLQDYVKISWLFVKGETCTISQGPENHRHVEVRRFSSQRSIRKRPRNALATLTEALCS